MAQAIKKGTFVSNQSLYNNMYIKYRADPEKVVVLKLHQKIVEMAMS